MTKAAWRNRGHAAYWAFLVHRISGLALALFLPLHFFALSRALNGVDALDAFLAWTRSPRISPAACGCSSSSSSAGSASRRRR